MLRTILLVLALLAPAFHLGVIAYGEGWLAVNMIAAGIDDGGQSVYLLAVLGLVALGIGGFALLNWWGAALLVGAEACLNQNTPGVGAVLMAPALAFAIAYRRSFVWTPFGNNSEAQRAHS